MGLPDPLLRAVKALGYEHPTPVQTQTIPPIAAGRDVTAEAQTGSGKTAAFALPILSKLDTTATPEHIQALTVAPTRELALQVAASYKALAKFMAKPPRVLAVIGGESIDQQISALHTGVSIVVATPGRLLDLVDHGDINLSTLTTLVLDEADKLLDLGFSDELTAVLQALPSERQTLLFSATLPPKVLVLAEHVLNQPVTVQIEATASSVGGIEQRVFEVDNNKRRTLLQHLIQTEEWAQTLVFSATRRGAHNLAAKLRSAGLSADALHGGLEQPDRMQVLRRFRRGDLAILTATDIAARGIDVPKLDAVVNYDLPRSPQDYVHRIGRTGRAGESGVAVSFIDHESAPHFALIEKRAEVQLTRERVEGFELTGAAPKNVKGKAPVKGKRKSKKDKLREAAAAEASTAAEATTSDAP
ncbi:MAG: DEAD/DEAH box helicase [Rhodobacterales bacterium]|nr:DEAD/DEAH box helicase [Rhodobacterales bacterium]